MDIDPVRQESGRRATFDTAAFDEEVVQPQG
jgi:hypothetical protein